MSRIQYRIILTLLAVVIISKVHFMIVDYGEGQAVEQQVEEVDMKYFWLYESTPADRLTMLQGLSAKECIDAGLCQLKYPTPLAE